MPRSLAEPFLAFALHAFSLVGEGRGTLRTGNSPLPTVFGTGLELSRNPRLTILTGLQLGLAAKRRWTPNTLLI